MDLQHIKDQVWQEIKQAVRSTNHTDSFWDNMQGFVHAVDWREKWIIGLLSTHVLIFLLVILLRRHTTFLSLVFLVLGAVVYFGESINRLAAQQWQSFAAQDYFDAHGIFYSVMVSAPAVVNLFAVLILYLMEVTSLMITVKRKEIIHRAKARAKAEGTVKKQQ